MGYKYPTPQLLFKAICNAIRSKTGNSDEIPHQDIPDELDSIITEEECEIAARELSNIIYGSDVKVLDSKYILNIASYKFYGSGLTTVNLPKCTSIRISAFSGCTSLTTVNLPECTTLGYGAFSDCTNLTTVNLPKCTYIESNAFQSCTNLTTIVLPKCTYINTYAFKDCTSLTTVNLPECTDIRTCAFENCTNLTTIILSNNQVVTLGATDVFRGSGISRGSGYIYVPDNLVDSYKSDTNWSTYANQIKPLSELPNNIKEEYGYD